MQKPSMTRRVAIGIGTCFFLIAAASLANPDKAAVIKITTANGGLHGTAQSTYGIATCFSSSLGFSCMPGRNIAKFDVTQLSKTPDKDDIVTTFYPKTCGDGFNALFGQKNLLTGFYKMPDNRTINDQWRHSPASFGVRAHECTINNTMVSAEDFADGTGTLEYEKINKIGKAVERTSVQISGFSGGTFSAGGYSEQAQLLCDNLRKGKEITAPRGVLTTFYALNKPESSLYIGNGSHLEQELYGLKPYYIEVEGNPDKETLRYATKELEKASNGEVKASDMQKLFTNMTGIILEPK